MRLRLTSLLLTAAAALLAACGGDGGGSGGAAGGDSLVTVAEVQGPDSGWAIETNDAFVLARWGVAEPLARISFDNKLEPWLAESWERVDEKTWSFKLREGVKFQDGEPLTADAVVKALNYLLGVSAPPRAFPPELVASVEAAGEREVVVRTKQPDPLMPSRLASPATSILSPVAYKKKGPPDPFGHGTGPFELSGYNPGQDFELTANADYWGGDVGLDSAVVRLVKDDEVRAGMAQSGEADIVMHLPIPMLPVLRDADGIKLHNEVEPRTETLYMNQKNPVLGELQVRKAIAHAIDNDAIAKSVLENAAKPAHGPFPDWEPWAQPDQLTMYEYDPDESRRLLSEAGYGKDDLSFEMVISSRLAYFTDMAAAVQEMLKNVGITVKIRTAEYAALEPDLLGGKYEMYLGSRGHLVDVNDPGSFFLSDYTCKGTYNLSQYCDPAFDEMVTEAIRIENQEERWGAYQELTEWIQTNVLSSFVVHTQLNFATATTIKNFDIHPLNHYVLTADVTTD